MGKRGWSRYTHVAWPLIVQPHVPRRLFAFSATNTLATAFPPLFVMKMQFWKTPRYSKIREEIVDDNIEPASEKRDLSTELPSWQRNWRLLEPVLAASVLVNLILAAFVYTRVQSDKPPLDLSIVQQGYCELTRCLRRMKDSSSNSTRGRRDRVSPTAFPAQQSYERRRMGRVPDSRA